MRRWSCRGLKGPRGRGHVPSGAVTPAAWRRRAGAAEGVEGGEGDWVERSDMACAGSCHRGVKGSIGNRTEQSGSWDI